MRGEVCYVTAPLQPIQRYREAFKTTYLATRSSIAHTKAPSELTVDLTGERAVDSKNGRKKTNIRKRQARSVSASE
jgi:hypothetical protein